MGRYRAIFRRYPDVVTAEQMREMLGVGTRTAYRLLRENKIQSVRMGRIYPSRRSRSLIFSVITRMKRLEKSVSPR